MRRYWTLVRADFAREYGIADDVALLHMGWRLFVDRVMGLSAQSRFGLALAAEPDLITDPDEIDALLGRM